MKEPAFGVLFGDTPGNDFTQEHRVTSTRCHTGQENRECCWGNPKPWILEPDDHRVSRGRDGESGGIERKFTQKAIATLGVTRV